MAIFKMISPLGAVVPVAPSEYRHSMVSVISLAMVPADGANGDDSDLSDS